MVSVAQYKKLISKEPKRNKRHEAILQEQCKNRFQYYKLYKQLLIDAVFVHIGNERIFSEALIKFMAVKGCPLNTMQAKILRFYLSGFAKNLARAGVFKGFLDNIIVGDGAKIIFFELKIGDNKPSIEQAAVIRALMTYGFPVYLIYSIDEFEAMLKQEGLLRGD